VTAGSSLRSLARALRLRGVVLALAGLRDELVQRLRAVGAEEELGQLEAHRTIEACLEALPTPTQKFHSA